MKVSAALLLSVLLAATAPAGEDDPSPRAVKVADWAIEKTSDPATIQFGPTGRWLAVSWNRLRVYSLPDARLERDEPDPDRVPPVFDRCGRLLCHGVGGANQPYTVKVIDLDAGKVASVALPVSSGPMRRPVVAGISSDANHVMVRSAGPLLRTGVALDSMSLFDLRTRKPVLSVPDSYGETATFGDGFVAYLTRPPGSGGRGQYRLKVFDLVKNREVFDLPAPVGRELEHTVLAPDGRSLLLRNDGGRVDRYVPSSGKSSTVLNLELASPDTPSRLMLSANGNRLAAWLPESGQVVFCDLEKGERFELGYGPKRCRLLGMSADGRYAWLASSMDVGVYDIVERKWREPLLTEHAMTAGVDPTGHWVLTVLRKETCLLLTLYRIR